MSTNDGYMTLAKAIAEASSDPLLRYPRMELEVLSRDDITLATFSNQHCPTLHDVVTAWDISAEAMERPDYRVFCPLPGEVVQRLYKRWQRDKSKGT